MWTRSVLAVALAGSAITARAAEPAMPAPENAGDGDSSAKTLKKVRVEATGESQSVKAETQTSASKLELTMRETPQSVSVITQESLRARQVTDFGQALELSAGVVQTSGTGPFAGQAGWGFNFTSIRGIQIDDHNDFREDGFVNTSYFAIPDMAIYDRIEVIKGPNSGVYGRGSAGGLINRIRKKPLTDTRLDVSLSAGSYDNYRADVDLTGPIDDDRRFLGRLVAAFGDEGSFVHGVDTQRTVLAPSLDTTFDSGTHVLVEGLYQRDNFRSNPGFPLKETSPGKFDAPDMPRSLYVGVPNRHGNQWNIYSGAVQVDQPLADDWVATLRIHRSRTQSPIAMDSYAVYGISESGDVPLARDRFSIDRDIWASELRLTGVLHIAGKDVQIATGAEFSDNDYHRAGAYAYFDDGNIYTREFFFDPGVPLEPGFEYTTRDKVMGYYLQAQVRPIDKLSVLAGLRYDRANSKFVAVASGDTDHNKDSDVTGRVGLTYDVTDNLSVYGLYAQSYSPVLTRGRSGGFLKPETGEIYEVGLKTEWFDKRFAVNVAAYRIDRENIAIGAPTLPGEEPYSISSGLQRSKGFEIEINGEPIKGWTINAAYNRLDSDFKDPDDPFYGQQLSGMAKWQASAYTSYELQSGPLKGFAFGASVFATPERGVSAFQTGTLDGYTRTDLNFAYRGWQRYEIQLSVRNVFDERYVEGADRVGAYAQFGSPAAWMLTARYHVGS